MSTEVTNLDTSYELEEIKSFKHATIYLVKDQKTAIIVAEMNYIPIDNFKEIFHRVGDLVKAGKVEKLVFDKRNLTVFHQPSMEWYFVEWKENMFDHGLRTHRKILPTDNTFRHSVKIGRDKINKDSPNGKFHQMDIAYFDTIDEAIEK